MQRVKIDILLENELALRKAEKSRDMVAIENLRLPWITWLVRVLSERLWALLWASSLWMSLWTESAVMLFGLFN